MERDRLTPKIQEEKGKRLLIWQKKRITELEQLAEAAKDNDSKIE